MANNSTIDWKKSGNGYYTAYAYVDGRSYFFEVFSDGTYKGVGTSNSDDPKASSPNTYISGRACGVKEAMESLEAYSRALFNKSIETTSPVEESASEVIIEKVEEIPVAPVVEDLSWTPYDGPDGRMVELKSRAGGKIKYTLDGKDVTSVSKVYKEPISVVEGMVIKAKSFDALKTEIGSIEFEALPAVEN